MNAASARLIETIRPVGYVYGPEAPGLDLDALVGRAGNERWSRDGELALYAALAPEVVLGEWSRHLIPDQPMTAWRLAFRELRVVDLRRREVAAALALPAEPSWVLDPGRTRSVAAMIRRGLPVDGLVVPSVAFLDRSEAANLVVWLAERSDVRELVARSEPLGRWSWAADEAS